MKIKILFLLLIFIKIFNSKEFWNAALNFEDNFDYIFNILNNIKSDYKIKKDFTNNNDSRIEVELIYHDVYKFTSDLLERMIIKAKYNGVSDTCLQYYNNSLNMSINSIKNNNIDYDNGNMAFPLGKILSTTLQSSSLEKNGLNYFEGCLDIDNFSYFVVVVDATKAKNTTIFRPYKFLKTILDYEDSFYLYGFCLPFNKEEINCTSNDYRIILKIINEILRYILFPEESDINVYSIKLSDNSKNFSIVILVILLIIFILITFNYPIFLMLKKIYRKEKTIKNKSLIDEEIEEENINNVEINEYNKYIISKSLIKLNNCFSLRDNLEELFNLKSNITEVNDYTGITEIRGLNSISILLTQLGLTFIAIYNTPLKIAGITQIRIFFQNFFYSFIFFGLRYSPRLMFSCSGYTLAFKYLYFIDKNNEGFSMFKFIFYQSHKFFLLIFFFLFTRYSLNYIVINTMGDVSPNWAFFHKSLVNNYEEKYKYWLSFLGIDLFLEDKTKKADQNLSDYFWIPFNEVYFFLFGVILLTIGYKCKMKIDVFVLFLIIFGFTGKIFFSYYYREEFYSTLYYYLFDYGKFMLNPLFNLTYFLIGFYFGLMNFALLNCSTHQFDKSIYRRIKFLSFDNIEEGIEEEKNEKEKKELNKDVDKEEENDDLNDNIDDDDDNKKKEFKGKINYLNKKFNENNNIINKSIDNDNDNNNIEESKTQKSIINPEIESSLKKNEEMPFLSMIIKYIEFIKNHETSMIIYVFFSILILIPILSHYVILYLYHNDSKIKEKKNLLINNKGNGDMLDLYYTLNLKEFLSNKYLNAIFRIDIEIVIFLAHWFIFKLKIKGSKKILPFFRHMILGVLSKSYFSFTIISNIVILFIIYSNETVITINIYMILLFYFLNAAIIIFFESAIYVYLEISLKKFIRFLFRKENSGKNIADENEDNLSHDKK